MYGHAKCRESKWKDEQTKGKNDDMNGMNIKRMCSQQDGHTKEWKSNGKENKGNTK